MVLWLKFPIQKCPFHIDNPSQPCCHEHQSKTNAQSDVLDDRRIQIVLVRGHSLSLFEPSSGQTCMKLTTGLLFHSPSGINHIHAGWDLLWWYSMVHIGMSHAPMFLLTRLHPFNFLRACHDIMIGRYLELFVYD